MKSFFLTCTFLAVAAALQAAAPPPDPAVAARVAVSLALAQRQAAVKPAENLKTWYGVLKWIDPDSPTYGDKGLVFVTDTGGTYFLKFNKGVGFDGKWEDGITQLTITGQLAQGPNFDSPAIQVFSIQVSTRTAPSSTYSFLVLSRTACAPCSHLADELHTNGDTLTYDIFVGRNDLDAKYAVAAYPTILLLRDGVEAGRHVGYMSAADMIQWLANPDAPQSRGEAVERATYSVVQRAACST